MILFQNFVECTKQMLFFKQNVLIPVMKLEENSPGVKVVYSRQDLTHSGSVWEGSQKSLITSFLTIVTCSSNEFGPFWHSFFWDTDTKSDVKGTLMQIWKSPYMFVFIEEQCPENFSFLILIILKLFTWSEVCKFVKK